MFSDLAVIALSATAGSLEFDSENYLFKRLNAEIGEELPNFIPRRQYSSVAN